VISLNVLTRDYERHIDFCASAKKLRARRSLIIIIYRSVGTLRRIFRLHVNRTSGERITRNTPFNTSLAL